MAGCQPLNMCELELGEGINNEGVALGHGRACLDSFDDDRQVSHVQIRLLGKEEQQVEV